MKIITKETKNKFKLFIFYVMSLLLDVQFNSLKSPYQQRHTVFPEIFCPFSQKRCLEIINTWMSKRRDLCLQHRSPKSLLDSNQAMEEATSLYSKILEYDVCTSLEFLLRCGVVLHLVGRWMADVWNVFHLFNSWN